MPLGILQNAPPMQPTTTLASAPMVVFGCVWGPQMELPPPGPLKLGGCTHQKQGLILNLSKVSLLQNN
jgi:hypothetical protein